MITYLGKLIKYNALTEHNNFYIIKIIIFKL